MPGRAAAVSRPADTTCVGLPTAKGRDDLSVGGYVLRYPLDLGQPGQGGPRQDLPDVEQCHEELLDSVQRRLVAGVQEDPLVVLG